MKPAEAACRPRGCSPSRTDRSPGFRSSYFRPFPELNSSGMCAVSSRLQWRGPHRHATGFPSPVLPNYGHTRRREKRCPQVCILTSCQLYLRSLRGILRRVLVFLCALRSFRRAFLGFLPCIVPGFSEEILLVFGTFRVLKREKRVTFREEVFSCKGVARPEVCPFVNGDALPECALSRSLVETGSVKVPLDNAKKVVSNNGNIFP
jgi:hypothetical protein